MNRRAFLAGLTAAVIDPERVLWVPGRRLISIPRDRQRTLHIFDIDEYDLPGRPGFWFPSLGFPSPIVLDKLAAMIDQVAMERFSKPRFLPLRFTAIDPEAHYCNWELGRGGLPRVRSLEVYIPERDCFIRRTSALVEL